jgi:hypothetical protein
MPTTLGKAFFSSAPQWVEKLLILRNNIVRVFGIKSPNLREKEQYLSSFKCAEGEEIGLFKVFSKSPNEVILGQDDKHLNFRVSLFIQNIGGKAGEKTIVITTAVIFNNWFGRLYFLPVKPFHKLVVPAILKGMVRKLQNQ